VGKPWLPEVARIWVPIRKKSGWGQGFSVTLVTRDYWPNTIRDFEKTLNSIMTKILNIMFRGGRIESFG
jgi:hypothetical protein